MGLKTFRRATVLAFACLLATAAVAFADTIPADGDQVAPGEQRLVYLGEYAPGEVVNTSVSFALFCAGLSHADAGQTITVQLSSVQVPTGGAASATSTTIGPVPADWTLDNEGCPSPAPRLPANGLSNVTLRMPTTVGDGWLYTLMYARLGANGLSGSTAITFEVDVVANTPPVLSLPAPISAEATSAAGAAVAYTAGATDAEDNPAPTPVCSPASGADFALGTTTVACSVTDAGGLSASGSFSVTVVDTTAPTMVLPANMTAEATSPAGASVSFATSASDAVDGSVAVGCDHGSGDTIALGATTVSCSATDTAGNSTSGSFTVTVVDTTAPALVLPADQTAEATSPAGASVSFSTSASDAVDGPVAVVCDHGSGDTFALGATAVSCSATDAAGNAAFGTFNVTVGDATGPTLVGMPGNISVTTSNGGGAVSYTPPTATDAADPSPNVVCSPASGSTFAVGSTDVTCAATDATGNSTSAGFNVTVGYVAPPVDVAWSARWGEPLAGSPAALSTNTSRNIPIKVRLFADGVERTTGSASLRIVACGGDTALVVALNWGSGRWNGHLDTSLLQPGCYVAVASLNDNDAGSFALDVRGPDPVKTPAAGHVAATAPADSKPTKGKPIK